MNGIHVLHDRWAEIRPGLILVGVDDLTSRRHGGTGNSVQVALQGRPAGAATMLISHTPWEVEAAATSGVELSYRATRTKVSFGHPYLVRLAHPFLAGDMR